MNTSELQAAIEKYYTARGLKRPNPDEALKWARTEIEEAAAHCSTSTPDIEAVYKALANLTDLQLMQSGGWVRNDVTKERIIAEIELREAAADVMIAANRLPGFTHGTGGVVSNPRQFAEEAGDVLMMVLMAGYAVGVDPLASLLAKMKRKTGIDF